MERIDKQTILEGLLKDGGDDNWLKNILDVIDTRLMGTPILYREYGPYWWGLKRVLGKFYINELNAYSGELELGTIEEFGYNDDKLDVAAAVMYAYDRPNNEISGLEIHGDGYIINDPEFEEIAQVSAMFQLNKSYRKQQDTAPLEN